MKKAILVAAAVATIAASTLSTPADARWRGQGVGLGLLGLGAGVMLGAAIASHPGYYYYEGYGAPPPFGCPYGGYWARQPIQDAYGNVVGWSQPAYFCR